MSKSGMAEKVMKLLALATSSNPHEAALAASKAKALMDEHDLTLDEVQVKAEGVIEERIIPKTKTGKDLKFLPEWMKSLIGVMERRFNVDAFWTHWARQGKCTACSITFVGNPTDVEIVKYTFNFLCREIHILTNHESRVLALSGEYEGNKWSYLNSYRLGIVHGVEAELAKKAASKREKANIGAIVIVKKALIKKYMEEKHNKMKESGPSLDPNSASYFKGRKIGQELSIKEGLKGEPKEVLQIEG